MHGDEKENFEQDCENFLSKKVVGNNDLSDRQHRKRSFLQQVCVNPEIEESILFVFTVIILRYCIFYFSDRGLLILQIHL